MLVRLGRAALVVAALAYLLLFLPYFVLLLGGEGRAGWLAFVRELTFYLFLPALALLVLAVLLRAWPALPLLALPVLVFAVVYAPRFWPQTAASEGSGAAFRVMTFNAGGNAGGGSLGPLQRTVQSVGADVVALQEVPPDTLAALKGALAADYPYQVGGPDAIIFSRVPAEQIGDVRLAEDSYAGQQVRLTLPGGPVTLTNVHVYRPRYRLQWRRFLPVVRGFNPGERDDQVARLAQLLTARPGPRLLAGDFNETEWSLPYETLTSVLQDSYRTAGSGFGHTYPSNVAWGRFHVSLPLMRIDYVFHSGELAARRAWVGPDGGSDHLPVVAELAFR